jgi:uncharacterized protein YecT (DUF1311 family)
MLFLLAAMSALAGQPPTDTAPDSGLAGVWRVVGAQSAPWVKPKKLTRADAPLLEYAVEFAGRAVKGPAPLGCASARYGYGGGPEFGGRLVNDAMRTAVHLMHGSTVYRVACGTALRDYYIDDEADLLTAEGDVIYTLQRPDGMDPEQYKAGFSGPSIDCTKARTAGEKLICIDVSLAKSDQKLGAAWRKLKQSISPESFARFQAAQRAWIAYEMKDCGGDTGPVPEYAGDKNKITECLGAAFDARAELFEDLKTERAGAFVIEPNIRFRTRSNPDTEETDIYPVMSGGPQAVAFNQYVAKALKLTKWRMDDKSLFQFDDVADMKLHAHRSYAVLRFDAHVAAIDIVMSDYVGGHDEQHGDTTLTWNMQKSAAVTLGDVFAPGKDWKKFVMAYCAKDLKRQTDTDGITDDLTDADMDASISDGANWAWNKDHATVGFLISMGGGGPMSAYNVDIPYKLLKPFMTPDAPVL